MTPLYRNSTLCHGQDRLHYGTQVPGVSVLLAQLLQESIRDQVPACLINFPNSKSCRVLLCMNFSKNFQNTCIGKASCESFSMSCLSSLFRSISNNIMMFLILSFLRMKKAQVSLALCHAEEPCMTEYNESSHLETCLGGSKIKLTVLNMIL